MAESGLSGKSLDRRFTLIRPLGSGGMGEVWLARDEETGREVAAKILPPETSDRGIALLEREHHNLARLSHPNIVPVLGLHRTVSGPVLITQAVQGTDIGSLRGRPPAEILDAVIPLADALAYAHESGVVHRDLKPSNVLIDQGGSARLVDFGLSGLLDDGVLRGGGSGLAASPEQRAGEPPHPADDAWGLGMLLRVLLSGTGPDPGGSLASPWPLPDELRRLIADLTAPRRDARLVDMNEIRRRLERIRAELPAADPASGSAESRARPPVPLTPPPRVGPTSPLASPAKGLPRSSETRGERLHWSAWAVIGALTLVALAVFLLLPDWVRNRQPAAARPEASIAAVPSPPSPAPTPVPAVEEDDPAESPVLEAPPPRRAPPPERRPLPTRSSAVALGGATSQIRSSPFEAAMSEGLAALERDQLVAARDAFARALSLDPESTAAGDGLRQAEDALRRESARRLGRSAAEHEAAQRWPQALADYEAILALDPALGFALAGRQRSRDHKEIDESLAYHLDHLDRLTSAEVRETVAELLARAEAAEPGGSRLDERAARLRRELELYSTPVPVVLISDGLTEVVVYRVGRQGTFGRKELELRPGRYTVVGSRPGYRDVRKTLEVPAGATPEPLTVSCEERI